MRLLHVLTNGFQGLDRTTLRLELGRALLYDEHSDAAPLATTVVLEHKERT